MPATNSNSQGVSYAVYIHPARALMETQAARAKLKAKKLPKTSTDQPSPDEPAQVLPDQLSQPVDSAAMDSSSVHPTLSLDSTVGSEESSKN